MSIKAMKQEPVAWIELWHGSGPDRGWWVWEAGLTHGNMVAYIGEGEFAERLASLIVEKHNATLRVPPAAPTQDSDHQFKNFHRVLCERFGYTHDEVDWKRDQVSLIEWIAKQVKPAAPVQEPPTDEQIIEVLLKARRADLEASGIDTEGLRQESVSVGWFLPYARAVIAAFTPPAEVQEPVLYINPKVIDPATGKVRNGTGALTYSDNPCGGWSMPLYGHQPLAAQLREKNGGKA